MRRVIEVFELLCGLRGQELDERVKDVFASFDYRLALTNRAWKLFDVSAEASLLALLKDYRELGHGGKRRAKTRFRTRKMLNSCAYCAEPLRLGPRWPPSNSSR